MKNCQRLDANILASATVSASKMSITTFGSPSLIMYNVYQLKFKVMTVLKAPLFKAIAK